MDKNLCVHCGNELQEDGSCLACEMLREQLAACGEFYTDEEWHGEEA